MSQDFRSFEPRAEPPAALPHGLRTATAMERDLAQLRGALMLVSTGQAASVTLCGLQVPDAAAFEVEGEARVQGISITLIPAAADRLDIVVRRERP